MTAPDLAWEPPPELPARDDFDDRTLAPLWSGVRNPYPRDRSLSARPGFLRLRGSPVTLDDVDSPALVARPQAHFAATMRAALEFEPQHAHDEAGLTLRANESFRYDQRRSGRLRLVRVHARRVGHRAFTRRGVGYALPRRRRDGAPL